MSAAADPGPAARAALDDWLTHLRARARADRTVAAYGDDVRRYLCFLAMHLGGPPTPADLAALPQADLRSFLAQEQRRGVAARSLARRLSAVRSFTRFLADRTGADATPVLSARGPRHRRRQLPAWHWQ